MSYLIDRYLKCYKVLSFAEFCYCFDFPLALQRHLSLLRLSRMHQNNLFLFTSLIPIYSISAADRSPERARELRRLVRALPEAHYETLKYLIQHMRRVVAHSAYNKMEARNLAIVFGPTLVRAASDDMLAMVNDMSSQCRIIESFLTHVSIPFMGPYTEESSLRLQRFCIFYRPDDLIDL